MVRNSDPRYDIVVIGSGAAGISAALRAKQQGLSALVLEKEPYLGGTTAISGGWLWVPGNQQGVREGDTATEAKEYIKNLAGESYDEAAVDRFLHEVPGALQFFANDTQIEFAYPEMAPDYQMDVPGARKSGRALTVQRADGRSLKENRLRVQPYLYPYTVFGYMPEVGPEIATFLKVNRSVKAFAYVTRRLLTTWAQRVFRRRAFARTNGNAVMTRLIATAGDQNIPMWTNTKVTDLLQDEEGVVNGVVLSGEYSGVVRARMGVLLAAGGFSGDREMRQKYFPHDGTGANHVTPTVGNDGDSYRLARQLGGQFDSSPHQPAAWAPVTTWRNLRGQDRIFPHLRAFGLPGLIAVNGAGRRFANESHSYHDFGVQMLQDDGPSENTTGYIIADRKAMRAYGVGYAKPWPLPTWYYKKVGYLVSAGTLDELARKIGVPAERLRETVNEFNADAAQGVDSKFQRGSNWFHHFKGDMEHKPNPNLETIDRAPYYAVQIRMGDLGTYAGLAVNERSEVVDSDGQPITGLYAAGTAAVSVFGGGYPGYGANIGPAMVFGHQVGRDIAQHATERTHSVGGTGDGR